MISLKIQRNARVYQFSALTQRDRPCVMFTANNVLLGILVGAVRRKSSKRTTRLLQRRLAPCLHINFSNSKILKSHGSQNYRLILDTLRGRIIRPFAFPRYSKNRTLLMGKLYSVAAASTSKGSDKECLIYYYRAIILYVLAFYTGGSNARVLCKISVIMDPTRKSFKRATIKRRHLGSGNSIGECIIMKLVACIYGRANRFYNNVQYNTSVRVG